MAIIDGNDLNNNLPDTSGDDTIDAMGGDDTITVTTGRDDVYGGTGEDTLIVAWGDESGPITLVQEFTYAYVGVDFATATRRVDWTGIEHLKVSAGSGNDTLEGSLSSWDILDGGAGTDEWDDDFTSLSTGLSIDMALVSSAGGQTYSDGTTVRNLEIADLYLTDAGNDTFRDHGAFNDTIFGQGGDDDIGTSGGQDNFYGGLGEDTVTIDWSDATDDVTVVQGVTYGYVGVDFASATRRVDWSAFEHLNVMSGSGNDNLEGTLNSWDILDGGAGTDEWDDDFTNLSTALSIDMAIVSTAGGQTYSDGTTVRNLEIADLYLTDAGDDTFRDHGDHNDTIFGQGGDDDIGTSGGQDNFYGGLGDDTLTIDWSDATDHVGLFQGVTYGYVGVDFGSSTRRVDWSSFEHLNVKSGSGDDILEGVANQSDVLDGGAGTDEWDDDFTSLTAAFSIDMAQVSTSTGQTFSDGTTVRNLEIADLYLSNTGGDTFRDSGAYNDTVFGQGGNDDIGTSGGQDYFDGGLGDDTLTIDWSDATDHVGLFQGVTYGFVGVDFGSSTRRVDWTGFEHLNVKSGSSDDTLEGVANQSDILDGGAGTDEWDDDFTNLATGLSIDMALVSSASGQTLSDGSTLRNLEIADLYLSDTGGDTFRDSGSYDDRVYGQGGDDNLGTSGGSDYIDGGAGTDTLVIDWSGTSAPVVISTALTLAYAGSDFASASDRVDWTSMEKLDVTAGNADDTLTALSNGSVMNGGGGNDTVTGDVGDDTLGGGTGADTLAGNDGNDILIGGGGADSIDGGAGNDTASYAGSAVGVNVQLQYGVIQGGDATGDTFTSIENLTGSDQGDTLYGNPSANILMGGGGTDYLKGLNGADKLYGDAGDDWLYVDYLDTVAEGGSGIDRLIVVNANGVTNAVGANGIEIATGNTGNDTFDGSGATADLTLRGRSGNDVLTGGDGDDYLYGDAGIDQLTGGAGLDRLFIDENDTLYNGGAGTQDRILVQQLASATSGVTVDMAASDVEVAYGNLNDDTFDGSSSTVALSLYGRNGQDVLSGGSANDRLFGDNNDAAAGDILNGGGGNDFLRGGKNGAGGFAERDQFVFDDDWGNDRIFDFADNGAEKIDFSSVAGITQRSDLTFSDVTDASGSYALIAYTDGGGWSASIRVYDVTATELQSNDFIFV